jgi:hypothetical protein
VAVRLLTRPFHTPTFSFVKGPPEASPQYQLCVRMDALDAALKLHKQAETDTQRAEALGVSLTTMWRLRKKPHIATNSVVTAVIGTFGDKYPLNDFLDTLFEVRDLASSDEPGEEES